MYKSKEESGGTGSSVLLALFGTLASLRMRYTLAWVSNPGNWTIGLSRQSDGQGSTLLARPCFRTITAGIRQAETRDHSRRSYCSYLLPLLFLMQTKTTRKFAPLVKTDEQWSHRGSPTLTGSLRHRPNSRTGVDTMVIRLGGCSSTSPNRVRSLPRGPPTRTYRPRGAYRT